jgi:hypothetical protein
LARSYDDDDQEEANDMNKRGGIGTYMRFHPVFFFFFQTLLDWASNGPERGHT